MTTRHMKRHFSWRISALGLVLSMGLIFGASQVIRLSAYEHPVEVEEACDAPAGAVGADGEPAGADLLARLVQAEGLQTGGRAL